MLHVHCLDHESEKTERLMVDDTVVKTGDFDRFFSEVERQAYRMADYALGNPDDALEVLQDAMLRLVEKYADRPRGDWPPLFYTILQSRIRDRQRRLAVRRRYAGLLSWHRDSDAGTVDPFQQVPNWHETNPELELSGSNDALAIESAVKKLPYRQQQTFLLRTWQGMSVKQTARIMRCSEGSVKTHLSRANGALREMLAELRYD